MKRSETIRCFFKNSFCKITSRYLDRLYARSKNERGMENNKFALAI